MADLVTHAGMPASGLPDDVRDLLQAVVDALTIPRPAATEHDIAAYDDLIDRRASDVRIKLESLLGNPYIITPAWSAEGLRKWTADSPVTYATQQDRGQS